MCARVLLVVPTYAKSQRERKKKKKTIGKCFSFGSESVALPCSLFETNRLNYTGGTDCNFLSFFSVKRGEKTSHLIREEGTAWLEPAQLIFQPFQLASCCWLALVYFHRWPMMRCCPVLIPLEVGAFEMVVENQPWQPRVFRCFRRRRQRRRQLLGAPDSSCCLARRRDGRGRLGGN